MKYSKNLQLGVTLIDALIAMVVAGVGLLALAFFQSDLVSTSADSKSKTQAIHIAQKKLEEFRNLAISSDFESSNALGSVLSNGVSGNSVRPETGDNTTYFLSWTILTPSDLDDDGYAKIEVSVSWDSDRDGAVGSDENINLSSFVAWNDPQVAADDEASDSSESNSILTPSGSGAKGGVLITDVGGAGGVSNADGTNVLYDDGDDVSQIVSVEDDGSLTPLVTSTAGFMRITGTTENYIDDDLADYQIRIGGAADCKFNNCDSDSLSDAEYAACIAPLDIGELGSGEFSCYAASDWRGNLNLLYSTDKTIYCSAVFSYENDDITAYYRDPDDSSHDGGVGNDPIVSNMHGNTADPITGVDFVSMPLKEDHLSAAFLLNGDNYDSILTTGIYAGYPSVDFENTLFLTSGSYDVDTNPYPFFKFSGGDTPNSNASVYYSTSNNSIVGTLTDQNLGVGRCEQFPVSVPELPDSYINGINIIGDIIVAAGTFSPSDLALTYSNKSENIYLTVSDSGCTVTDTGIIDGDKTYHYVCETNEIPEDASIPHDVVGEWFGALTLTSSKLACNTSYSSTADSIVKSFAYVSNRGVYTNVHTFNIVEDDLNYVIVDIGDIIIANNVGSCP